MTATCSAFEARGSQAWIAAPDSIYDRHDDPNYLVDQDCGAQVNDPTPAGRLIRDTYRTTATAAYTFAPHDDA